MSKVKTDERTRNWIFIMYPDSMPYSYDICINLLQDFNYKFAVSPLHDKDVNADGEPKKPHYHVLVTCDGNKSYSQIREMVDIVNGADCKKCNSVAGYYRYFTHKDNPEKVQYNELDIKCYNGFDGESYNKPLAIMRYYAIRDMMVYIKDNNITEYCKFLDYCTKYNFEWFKYLCDNSSYIVTEYIKSYRNHKKESALLPDRLCPVCDEEFENCFQSAIEDSVSK